MTRCARACRSPFVLPNLEGPVMEQVIELEALEKRFPSLAKPAVASLTPA
ncbi:Uncharacterised protein [Serratia plymuthica]|uniref:Uncharacterized protein n=1 Tax=Serratia plymuthica TaxID=82996 RepID=A0A2X4UIB3_SERPL|nr:Uncharacterised protein [Serratia plymuthica]